MDYLKVSREIYQWIFRLGRPLESEGANCAHDPAFLSCANKMMTYLLEVDGRAQDRGIRPHRLKLTTIPSLMTEVTNGQANSSQLAIRANYRDVAAQDMDKVYSRNIAQKQLSVSDIA